MKNITNAKNIVLAIIYFAISTLLTWWFVDTSTLYSGIHQKLLSTSIAGAKWALQIGAAYFLLAEKKWLFIKYIGFTCFIGSLILHIGDDLITKLRTLQFSSSFHLTFEIISNTLFANASLQSFYNQFSSAIPAHIL